MHVLGMSTRVGHFPNPICHMDSPIEDKKRSFFLGTNFVQIWYAWQFLRSIIYLRSLYIVFGIQVEAVYGPEKSFFFLMKSGRVRPSRCASVRYVYMVTRVKIEITPIQPRSSLEFIVFNRKCYANW